ncbi:Transposable element P transposase [Frankliniella fusca]|uniref:Transposable element P transposase n=1 Tax=Frankliniella fusca TaxID=407009 RepID=A0AAE1LE32_9NEOP|nr:Transposable element P transposase [Frankliniella fusca]
MCPDHFPLEQFTNKFKIKLRLNAVPSLFANPPLNDEIMQRYDHPDVFITSGPDDSSPPTLNESLSDNYSAEAAQVHTGKRPRENYEDDVDEGYFDPDPKNPRMDFPESTSPRRSLISTGAREREGTRRQIGLRDLAEMSEVSYYNSKDTNLVKVLKTTQQYRSMALDLRRKLTIAQRRNRDLTKTLNDRTVNILNELVISPKSRSILEGEMENFKVKSQGRRWSLQDKLFWLSVMKRGRGRTDFIADHAMVFVVQGLHIKWTQPVAYYFVSKTCPATLLKCLIEDVVKALTEIGLIVKATISDQGPTNRTAIDELRKSYGDNLLYSVGGQRLSRIKLSSLTMRHVNPQGRDKMRVSYAAQVFSSSVSKFIKAIVSISEGRALSHCLPFAELCDDIDTFFDLCNGPKTNENQRHFRANVSADSPHIKEDMWNKMISKLKTWTFIRQKDGVRHIPPCVRGWIENIKSFKFLWCSVKANTKVLKLRNLNQDALENLFCLIRQCGGSSSDLTLSQFTAAMKTCLISRFSRLVSSETKNCLDDESHMASDLSEYLLNDEEPTAAPPAQQSLLRGNTPNNFGRRPKVQSSNPLVRESISAKWVELLPDLLKKLNCPDCFNLLSTPNMHPSDRLISNFINCRNTFERHWIRVISNQNVSCAVGLLLKSSVQWDLFCSTHKNSSEFVDLLVEKIAKALIKQKCADCNGELRAKVSRRTRQALTSKNSIGLYDSEEEVALDAADLQFLLGAVPANTTVSTPHTPAPQTPAPEVPAPQTPVSQTPAALQILVPQILEALRTPAPQTPAFQPLAVPTYSAEPMTPRQLARAKVQSAWSTPCNSVISTPSSELSLSDETICDTITTNNTINKLKIPQLKSILRSKKLKLTGNKDELINRVIGYFSA